MRECIGFLISGLRKTIMCFARNVQLRVVWTKSLLMFLWCCVRSKKSIVRCSRPNVPTSSMMQKSAKNKKSKRESRFDRSLHGFSAKTTPGDCLFQPGKVHHRRDAPTSLPKFGERIWSGLTITLNPNYCNRPYNDIHNDICICTLYMYIHVMFSFFGRPTDLPCLLMADD